MPQEGAGGYQSCTGSDEGGYAAKRGAEKDYHGTTRALSERLAEERMT